MSQDSDDSGTLVDHVYDIAVSPERLETLIDLWELRLNGCSEPADFQVLTAPGVITHVQRAERVLREFIAYAGEQRDTARNWTESVRSAALVVNRLGVVTAANGIAERTLWLKPGNTLSVLPVVPEDLAVLANLIEHLDTATDAEVRLLRLRKLDESAPVLIRIVEGIGGDPDLVGLITSILAWPDRLSDRLMANFQFTRAEVDVLKDLTLGFSVKEIVERSERTEATIRSHLRALLAKTSTRSQIELVRLTLGLLDVTGPELEIIPMHGPPGISPEPNQYSTMVLPDGRRFDYLVIGNPRGRPFLMLPTDMGFTRLPPPAERWLADNRMRMIVPVRAGYGYSSPIPNRRDAFDIAIKDMLALKDHLRIDRCPVLAFCDDFHLAISLALAAPKQVTAIVGVGPTLPAVEPKHFQRMPKWTRFIYANARYAPRALPYVTLAFFQCIRRLGPRRFMQTVVATSKADLKVLEDDEILTSMLRGTEISVGPRFTAHIAWAAGAISNYAVDWSEKLKTCPVPIVLFAGHQDPFAPFETTKEFASQTPNITLHDFPQYGQLLYPEWARFLGEIQKHLSN
ncbi:MAG: LuxR C-terminal-related transcriptional regulator [Hyphomicrobium sp.]